MTITYYGNFNPDLLEMVPLTARHLLEIGCGEGALAAAYRARNPKVHYTAVEMHEASARKAGEVVDRLLTTDFETMDDAALTGGTAFDMIVLGDVLEHFAAPERVLARLHRVLAPDGFLAISVPNVSHWIALLHLIQGDWPAGDAGLFDRTHLRFFTLASLVTLLEGAGFGMVKTRPRQSLIDRTLAEKWVPALADLAEKMGQDRQQFLRRSSTLQYVVLAQKVERPRPVSIHLRTAVFAPTLMDARTRLPSAYGGSLPDVAVSYAEKDHSLPALPVDAPKVLIVQRHIPGDRPQWITRLAAAIRAGWVVVSEWDDHPDLIAAAIGRDAASMWVTIAAAHAVQTSTGPLADAFRPANPEVAIFPNTAFTLDPFPQRSDAPTRIFYGAVNRERFSVPVAEALRPVLKAHPELSVEVLHDRAFFAALPTAAKRLQPILPYSDYLAAMAGCDIALLPLEGHAGERFKSDIKYVEAASRGVAVIASPAVYGGTVRDGENGLVAATVPDWSRALRRLVEEPGLARRLARTAWEEVRDTRMFADQAAARRDWYRGLWARREALTASLVARVPELAEALARG